MEKLFDFIAQNTRTNKRRKNNKQSDSEIDRKGGVYAYNKSLRHTALSHLWATYNMLPDVLTDSLGRLSEIMEEKVIPEKNHKTLFDYTHDKSTVYSNTIAEKNLTVGGVSGNTIESLSETPKENFVAWHNTKYYGKNYYEVIGNGIIKDSKNKFYISEKNNIENKIDYQDILDEFYELTDRINEIKKPEKPKPPKKRNFGDENLYNEAKTKYEEDLITYKQDLKTWKNINKGRRSEVKREINTLQNEITRLALNPANIVDKTSELFLNRKIKTLTDQFYREVDKNESTEIDNAIVNGYISHGRSLLKKDYENAEKINGYNSPFCRAWTFHHQYGSSKDTLIRSKGYTFSENRFKDACGVTYDNYSVLKDGFVRITPEKKGNKYNTKSCMFSIENLAWKDVIVENELSKEQQGPNGGRIMWFPPYNLKFQENVNVNWNPTMFIGRGENIYTYTNTERMGTLSFTMLIDYPSVMDNYFNDTRNKEESEQEILRYFAGCDKCGALLANMGSNNGRESEGSNEETITFNPEDGETLKFNIYFPLNYSGHFNDTNQIDSDWVEYLIWGYDKTANYSPPGNVDNASGYEISDYGLNHSSYEHVCSSITQDEGYYYRVDKNSNMQKTPCNYVDYKSYKLNSTAEGEDYVSFLSFYTFLKIEDYSVLSWANKKNILGDDGKLTDKKLKDLKLEDLSGCTITITPYTSDQNKKITDKLSKKRAETVKDFLKKNIKTDNIEIKTTQKGEYDKNNDKGDGANGKESKKGRRVEVEIKYNKAVIEGDSKTTNTVNASQTQSSTTLLNLKYDFSTKPYKSYNESEYFKQIREKDNFLYEKIIDKVKYFEPAYHSLSPEGFNSRLNFLHQCTRQGHTIERKDTDTANTISTAWNTAFGKPPVCVLRIGDFMNTKILIQSMSITYENGNGIQWDLNPEGIGVQPMFANINLGIILIGGQSIDAPISRLNNAVSFNYYANTKIYDNRADFGMYNSTGVTYDEFYITENRN